MKKYLEDLERFGRFLGEADWEECPADRRVDEPLGE